jgi:phosphohistidine phosphatase
LKRVTLLRHAKAGDQGGLVDDMARPLTSRGRRDARAVGEELVKRRLQPDVILVSPSLRTMETAARAMRAFGDSVRVVVAPRLYEAGSAVIIEEIGRAPANCRHALVVGHNPGFQRAANDLADPARSGPVPLNRVKESFPTGAFAHYEFEGEDWMSVKAGAGALLLFEAPD